MAQVAVGGKGREKDVDLRGEQDTRGLGKKGAPAYDFSTEAGHDIVSQDGRLQPTGGDCFSAQHAQVAT